MKTVQVINSVYVVPTVHDSVKWKQQDKAAGHAQTLFFLKSNLLLKENDNITTIGSVI